MVQKKNLPIVRQTAVAAPDWPPASRRKRRVARRCLHRRMIKLLCCFCREDHPIRISAEFKANLQ